MNVTRTLRSLLGAIVLCLIPTASFAGYFAFVESAPPPLPVYAQPPCPAQGYLWTPGYWAHASEGYYWVPGVWVQPPRAGLLWTPGYWGTAGRVYVWHTGYWAPRVGFYGGVHYGFGYAGLGFQGGVWVGNTFHYSTAVTTTGPALLRAAYVTGSPAGSAADRRPSFNGPGGADVFPSPQETAASLELRFRPTADQLRHEQSASMDPSQLVSVNHGSPVAIAMDSVGGHRFDRNGHIAEGILSGRLTYLQASAVATH
jgi:hypothetical protein